MRKANFRTDLEAKWRQLFDSADPFLLPYYRLLFLSVSEINIDILPLLSDFKKERIPEVSALCELARYAVIGYRAQTEIHSFYEKSRNEKARLLASGLLSRLGSDSHWVDIHRVMKTRYPEPAAYVYELAEMVFEHCAHTWLSPGLAHIS